MNDLGQYIVTVIVSAALARLSVGALDYYISRELSLRQLFSPKNRIVSFSAGVIALVPAAIVFDGIDSPSFYGALVLTSITLLLGIRATASARKLSAADDESKQEQTGLLRYSLQRFVSSWAGALVMGVIFGFLVTIGQWGERTSVLTDVPPKSESKIYLYIFVGIIALSLALYWRLSRRSLRRLPTAAKLRRAISYAWFSPAIVGLIIALVQNQTRNVTLANRYFTIAVFVWIVVAELWVIINVLPNTLTNLRAERQHFEQQQRQAKRKKRKKNRK